MIIECEYFFAGYARKKEVIWMKNEYFFPNIITDLSRADIPIEGLDAYLLQGINQQSGIHVL